MNKNHRRLAVPLAALWIALATQTALPQTAQVEFHAYTVESNSSGGSPKHRYKPERGVSVTCRQEGMSYSVGASEPSGELKFRVRTDAPFDLLVTFGVDHVPELQSLAGGAYFHTVHVSCKPIDAKTDRRLLRDKLQAILLTLGREFRVHDRTSGPKPLGLVDFLNRILAKASIENRLE